ncbi:ricin-type beta-trefoil lectin domain protein [Phycicoccus sp. CSK15P-2]|uniref:glycoside hydrolase family 64 protein n=1 Tax=Phycicoccus sp. CSK15P-2 TaxID=2807627 RepID=UPI001951F52C|nr:beta-1,3-glucanase family protein [Phycicoccus sp. CSK15P-2]MBM6403297.1 ricin-type beta-trefoil lectin domain protein [Phycicoccus sp. CSK15P-2]
MSAVPRRVSTLLAALTSLFLLLGLAAAPAATAVGPDRLPMTISNSTGRGGSLHLYVIGIDLGSGRLGYVDAGGAFHAWPAGSNPPSPAPDVSIGGAGNGGSTTLQVPRNFSGRVYFSLGEKLKFFLTPDGLVQPAPWNSSDPNHDILFDWSEFTYNDSGLWLNSSQVDMFAMPHEVSVTGASGQKKSTGLIVDDGRTKVIDGIKAQSAWARTVVTRGDGTVLRVLSPGKAVGAGLLDAHYLDAYINQAWGAYSSKTLTVQPFGDRPDVKYYGRTSGSTMNFTNGSGTQVASFNKPSNSSVWGCDGDLPSPNDQVVGPISRTLCAALTRGTLGTIDTQPSTDASQFYKNSAPNHYARLVHANMADGKAYAFAYDDVGNFESLVHDGDPRSAGITLSPFTGPSGGGGGGGGNPPPPSGGGVAVVSDWNGKCLDVPNRQFNDGQRVQMYTCNQTVAQKWTFANGRVESSNGKCLDVAGGATADGTPVQIANCSSNAAQKWVLSSAGDLVNPQANKCLDIKDWVNNNGAQLQIWTCAGSANQKWHKG